MVGTEQQVILSLFVHKVVKRCLLSTCLNISVKGSSVASIVLMITDEGRPVSAVTV